MYEVLPISLMSLTYLFSRLIIILICPKSGLSRGSSCQHFSMSSISSSSDVISSSEGLSVTPEMRSFTISETHKLVGTPSNWNLNPRGWVQSLVVFFKIGWISSLPYFTTLLAILCQKLAILLSRNVTNKWKTVYIEFNEIAKCQSDPGLSFSLQCLTLQFVTSNPDSIVFLNLCHLCFLLE